jgi:hypothetical protein
MASERGLISDTKSLQLNKKQKKFALKRAAIYYEN